MGDILPDSGFGPLAEVSREIYGASISVHGCILKKYVKGFIPLHGEKRDHVHYLIIVYYLTITKRNGEFGKMYGIFWKGKGCDWTG
jgi:hypothetical protein